MDERKVFRLNGRNVWERICPKHTSSVSPSPARRPPHPLSWALLGTDTSAWCPVITRKVPGVGIVGERLFTMSSPVVARRSSMTCDQNA